MKNFKKLRIALTLALMVVGMATALAQNLVPTPGGNLYLNGRNISSPAVDVGTENPDLVTAGTKVQYLVIPDPILNPTWATAATLDATVTTGISSTWIWTVPAALGVLNATPSVTGHFINLDVSNTVSGIVAINVKEKLGAGGCTDGTGTNINVKVIAKPAATALAVSDGTGSSICSSAANTLLDLPLPIFTLTKTTDASIPVNPTIKIKASLEFTNHLGVTTTLVPGGTILNVDATTGAVSNADLTSAAGGAVYDDLDNWGTYTLKVTEISDKISRKDLNPAAGYFGAVYNATYTVLKTPTTGAIYHLPNN